jgi:ribosomal protein S18 acetylase RimI-like enzyme
VALEKIRLGTDADMAFFREMEFETTWLNLSPTERETLDPDEIRRALAETHELLLSRAGSVIFVAEDESGRSIGLLWMGENRNLLTGVAEAWVYNISVIGSRRGQGIGARLMAHAEAHARELGYQTLGLMVAAHNEAARRLYDRLGYDETNVIMRKKLSPSPRH